MLTGDDGVVRVVSVKGRTSDGEVKRGVSKVCVLPLEKKKSVNLSNEPDLT